MNSVRFFFFYRYIFKSLYALSIYFWFNIYRKKKHHACLWLTWGTLSLAPAVFRGVLFSVLAVFCLLCWLVVWSLAVFLGLSPLAGLDVGVEMTDFAALLGLSVLLAFSRRLDFLGLPSGVPTLVILACFLGLDIIGSVFCGVLVTRLDFRGLASTGAALARRLDFRGLASVTTSELFLILFWGLTILLPPRSRVLLSAGVCVV